MGTHTLTEAMGETITMDDFTPTLAPGDTVIISPSRTSAINLSSIVGSFESWITFTNPTDAKININDDGTISGALYLSECQYIRILGSNYSAEKYGIVLSTGVNGLRAVNTEDIEVAFLEMHSVSHVGINMNQCWAPWTCTEEKDNVTIHDNYIHDVGGEGLYLGKSSRAIAPKFRDIQIYNNWIEDCGWDGIQLGQTVGENNNIYNNTVIHCGHGGTNIWCWETEQYQTAPCPGQWFGIVIAPEHYGINIYQNYIEDPYYTGISIHSDGDGPVDIHDNVIFNAGYAGISVNYAGGSSTVINNTVISANYGIKTPAGDTTGEARYNLVVNSSVAGLISDYAAQNDNRISASIPDEYFVNAAAGNFRLTSLSPARDAGVGAGYSTIDFDENTRPYGSTDPDIGAFEYVGEAVLYTRHRGILRQKPRYNMVGGRFR